MDTKFHAGAPKTFLAAALLVLMSVLTFSCSSPAPSKSAEPDQGPKHYALTGRVVSIEKDKKQVTVDAGDIPGFMAAMTMGYDVKDPATLDSLTPEDQIKADLIVNQSDVHLENVVVTKKAEPGKTKAEPGKTPAGHAPDTGKQ
jgi:Cu/Ag efflux protein CusF